MAERILLQFARIGTTVVMKLFPLFSDRGAPIKNKNEQKIAVLVPILPDISHTFIYREVLAMMKHGGSFEIIGLLQGDRDIVHPEADALLKITTFITERTFLGYLCIYLKYLILMPRKFAGMLNYFKKHCHAGDDFFLKKEQGANLLHPMRCLLLTDMLRARGITLIHAYGASFPATMALGNSVLLDIPFSISTFVDFEHDYEFKLLSEKVNAADFLIVVTQYCKERIVALTSPTIRDKIVVIHSSVDGSYGDNVVPEPKGKLVRLISVARFVEKKGIEYLIRACAELKDRELAFECIVIGDGPEKDKFQNMIVAYQLHDYLRLVAPMQNDLIKTLYGRDTIAVMPCVNASDGERDGIPNVLLEAMLCGSPAVATNISGIPELIIDGENGLLVPEKDVAALANALERLIVSECLRENLSKNGRQTVQRDFNLDVKSQYRLELIETSGRNILASKV
jgi:colanic acid/amylovoran biosynthesis glycosyltransferase